MYEQGSDSLLIGVGSDFNGMARSNSTATEILKLLQSGCVDEADLVCKMEQIFDAPREVIARDVDGILQKLREIGAIDE